MMGRSSIELITKANVMAYRRILIADQNRSQINVWDRLEWAAQEEICPSM